MNIPIHQTNPDHLEAEMQNQARDPLGLSALPELQPPQDGWMAIAAQLQQQQRRRKQWLSGLAIAATVTLVAGLVSILPQSDVSTTPVEGVAGVGSNAPSYSLPEEQVVGASLAGDSGSVPLQEPDNLQALQNLSQRLEQNLLYLRTGVGAMPAEMVVYQVELEDLVAQVDDAISLQPESSELWQQRVSLLMDLNQIYGAGLRRDEPFVASL